MKQELYTGERRGQAASDDSLTKTSALSSELCTTEFEPPPEPVADGVGKGSM